MKTIRFLALSLFLTFAFSRLGKAQEINLEQVKSEIEAASAKEQQAFKEGNCDQVLDLMDDKVTFLANGRRVPSKEIIAKFCSSIPRPFKNPTVDTMEIYPLSDDSGYTVRTLEYPKDEKTKTLEYVTKIWRKTEGKWKISLLHSTVKETPN